MLYYDRIDFSEGIYVIKTSQSRKCGICHSRYFFDKGFKFRPDIYKGCHDVLMLFLNIAILNIQYADYHCIIRQISKSEAINLMQNFDLTEKAEHYKI